MTQSRSIIRITGEDRIEFLQGLVTNDLSKLDRGLVYAALLTPQGKYLSDFFLFTDPSNSAAILLDTHSDLAPGLLKRLGFYRLRAKVALEETDIAVRRGVSDPPPGALRDPRHADLGWRLYGATGDDDGSDFDAVRVKHCIPEALRELIPDQTFILEAGFERINGVDFKKGCYVGQEVTARMKHKTELRKGFVRVGLSNPVPEGTEVLADGRAAGRVCTVVGKEAIAYLRLDRAKGSLRAGDELVIYPA